MQKRPKLFMLGLALLIVFAGISVFTFVQTSKRIENGYAAAEGGSAQNLAVLTAANLQLSDAQVEALKRYSFAELQASPENEALRAMLERDGFVHELDSAAVLLHLHGDGPRYYVTEETQAQFDAPAGAVINTFRLLDVTFHASEPAADTDADDALRRYCVTEDARIFERAPAYRIQTLAQDSLLYGYAPLYSTEGTEIGLVCVALRVQNFEAYHYGSLRILGFLMVISTLTLALLFVLIYSQYRYWQYEKFYTDVLTHTRNRSYYYDQFVRRLNAEPAHRPLFALMMADIDWFKKVNDTYGHQIGDEVLVELCQALIDTFGRARVVRFGGEEFVVGLWVRDERELRILLDGLFARVRNQKFSRLKIDISISLGCALYPCSELNPLLVSDMLKAADCLLYQVKEHGRRQYRITAYDPETVYTKDTP